MKRTMGAGYAGADNPGGDVDQVAVSRAMLLSGHSAVKCAHFCISPRADAVLLLASQSSTSPTRKCCLAMRRPCASSSSTRSVRSMAAKPEGRHGLHPLSPRLSIVV